MLTGLIRVSFNKDALANNNSRYALTGTQDANAPGAPFQKKGTQGFVCIDADDVEVAKALEKFAEVIAEHATTLDFVSISMMRQPDASNSSP